MVNGRAARSPLRFSFKVSEHAYVLAMSVTHPTQDSIKAVIATGVDNLLSQLFRPQQDMLYTIRVIGTESVVPHSYAETRSTEKNEIAGVVGHCFLVDTKPVM